MESFKKYSFIYRFLDDHLDPEMRLGALRACLGDETTLKILSLLSDAEQAETPKEKIEIYDRVLERCAADRNAGPKQLFARALFSKGFTLGQLDRSEEAVAVYDHLLDAYAGDPDAELRRQCARALFSKGFTLGQLDRSEEAVAVFIQLIDVYGDEGDAELNSTCLLATQNATEMLLLLGRTDEAMEKGRRSLEMMGSDDKNTPIILFLIWLTGAPDVSPVEIRNTIRTLPSKTTFRWSFDEIAPHISDLPLDQREIAQAFVAFFQGTLPFKELERRLSPPT